MKEFEILTEEQLLTMWRDFNNAEKTVVGLQVKRLHQGQKEYGKWQPGDGRDKLVEAVFEFVDIPNYLLMGLLEMIKFWKEEK